MSEIALEDAGEQAARQSWLPIEYRQFTPGRYRGRFRELALPGQRVVIENQNQTILKSGVMPPGRCTISFVRASFSGARFSEYRVAVPAVYFLPGGTEFEVQLSGNVETTYFSFDQSALMADALALDESYWTGKSRRLSICLTDRVAALAAFADAVTQLSDRQGGGQPALLEHLSRSVMATALAAFDTSAGADPMDAGDLRACRRALHVVRRARDYIDHALDSDMCPTIVDVCRQAAVSQRTLQYCFLDVLQLTPVAYLRIARLHRVRADLRNSTAPGLKVGDVATRWGFWHLSKFAGDYRRLFGELPSETRMLRQAG